MAVMNVMDVIDVIDVMKLDLNSDLDLDVYLRRHRQSCYFVATSGAQVVRMNYILHSFLSIL